MAGDYDADALRALMRERKIDGNTPVSLSPDGVFVPLREHREAAEALGRETSCPLKVRTPVAAFVEAPAAPAATEHDRAVTGTVENTAHAMLKANAAYEHSLRKPEPPKQFLETRDGRHFLRWLKINGAVAVVAAFLHYVCGVDGGLWLIIQMFAVIVLFLTMRQSRHDPMRDPKA